MPPAWPRTPTTALQPRALPSRYTNARPAAGLPPASTTRPWARTGAPLAFDDWMVESILQAAPEHCWLDRRYQTDMAEALKAMTLEGHGVAWLPDSAIARNARVDALALAVRPSAAAAWRGEMSIRLYRDAEHTRPVVAALWEHLTRTEGARPGD